MMNKKLVADFADPGFYSSLDVQAMNVDAIHKILDVLPEHEKWCVEFGAWDGIVASNTRELILNHGYAAVLIEGDMRKFKELQTNYAGRPNVTTLNRFVGFDEKDGLDAIFSKTSIPFDFDFLCVDIDGNDYHVWSAMVKYHPKVLMIEFNPTIPPEVNFIQPADPLIGQGSSLASIIRLGKEKGYELVLVMGVNAFFVAAKYYSLFEIEDNGIHGLWTNRDCVTYLFSGYDGRIFLDGCKKLPWHESIPISESKMQVLPAFLRGSYTRRNRIIYTFLTDPASIWAKILNRIRRLNPLPRLGERLRRMK